MSPSFVSDFDHDIFLSYATVDDTPTLGRPGRVSTFVELLSDGLGRLLGRRDGFSIFMDRTKLDATFQLTPGLEKPLHKSAIMLALLSNGYLASPWCPWERKVFLEALKAAPGDRARVFIVELDRLEDDQRPKEFADYLACRFWVQGPLDKHPRLLGAYDPASDADYRSRVDGLARELATVLKEMKRKIGTPPRDPGSGGVVPPPKKSTTVYLAETTDDLEPIWRKVKGYLEQQDITVVPSYFLPRNPDEFEQAVKESLVGAELFVQLLSPVAGRKVDESRTYVAMQHSLASAAGIPVLQWRDARLTERDLEELADVSHRQLLEGANVQAVQIEEFKQEVIKMLARLRDERKRQKEREEKKQAASEGKNNDKFIFVVADPKDGSIAQAMFDYLAEQGYPCSLPITLLDADGTTTSAAIRADFEDNLQLADGAVIVYGQTQPTWCRSQLIEVRKLQVQNRANKRPCVMGVYEAPAPRPNLRISVPGMHMLPGKDAFDETALRPFLEALQDTVAAGPTK